MRERETSPIPFDPTDHRAPPRGRRRRLRRIARWALIGVGSLLALLGLALVFLQTRWGNELVRARVEKALAGKLDGGSVSLGSVDHSFLFGTIELGDLTIRDRSGAEAIALGSLHATLDRSRLLAREAVIDELAIRDLAVSIVKKADGTSNLTGLFKKSKGSSLERIAVGSLSVTGGRATIEEPDGTRIAVDRLALTGSVEAVPGEHAVEVALARLGAQVTVARPDAEPRALEVGVGTVALARRGGDTDLSVKDVMAGPLAVSSLALHASLVNGEARGQQSVVLSGLRLDSSELGRLIGKKLLASDIAVDARMAGPPDDLRITGQVATGGGTLALAGNLALGERPRYHVSLVGTGIDSQQLLATARLPVQSSLEIDVEGEGRAMSDMVGHLSASVGPTRAGKVALDSVEIEASWDHGAVSLEKLSARAPGIEVTAGGALDAARMIDGTLRVRGNPAEAVAGLGLALPIRALPHRLDMTVTARGALKGDLAVALAPTRVQLAGGAIAIAGSATLSNRKLTGASARIRLADLDLAALARLAGRTPKLAGSLGGSIDLTRTGPRTDVSYDLAALLDQPAVAVRVRGAAAPTAVAMKLDATRRRDGALLASADAHLPIATRGGKRALARTGDWHLVVDVGERSLSEIAELLPERLRHKLPPGAIAAHIDIGGTPARPAGSAHIDLKGAFLRGRPIEQVVRLDAAITSRGAGLEIATDGSVKIDGRQDPTALIRGGVSLPSLDRAALRRAVLDLSIELPARPLASFAGIRPTLARLPGRIGGGATVKGALPAPRIDSRLAWTGYRTADGGDGETALVISGTPLDLTATATMSGGLSIAADVHRGADGSVAIAARARADDAPLARVLPELVARRLDEPGRLRWHMDGKVALARQAGKLQVVDRSLAGTLQVEGAALAIPGSPRRWERIGLDLEAGERGLTIRSLSLHERDIEVADRRLAVSGTVAWDRLKPTRVALDLRGRDWLLFGTPLLGQSDAPRAAADLDVGVAIDLRSPVMKVDATVRRLDLRSPDRLDRGHQPEDITPNRDVIFIDGKTAAGKLPVPPRPAAATAPPRRHRRPMDIRVRIPRLVRLNQTPFDLRAKGEIRIAVRDDGTRVRGGLTIPRGSLLLFGKVHRLVDGKLSFTDEHPKGWIELTFRRRLSVADSRALAGMDEMQVVFAGPPTAPKPKLGGAGNAALAEAMAMNASGHPLYLSEPDMPATATVKAPRGDQLQMLSFMASNMPHLLFLDRFAAWADPTDGRTSYGRVERFEGERTSKSGRSRVRVVTRPPTPGRSSAEIQWDRLLMDRRRSAVGVGVRGGSRAGGGVGFFFEWASDD